LSVGVNVTVRGKGEPSANEPLFDCNVCEGSLFFLPDAYPLVFRCPNGHFLTLGDLLDRLLSPDAASSAWTGGGWPESAQLLHQLAARALQCGHAFAAADFQDAATRIDRWVETLQSLSPRSGGPLATAGT
jgi:hypothetical protein